MDNYIYERVYPMEDDDESSEDLQSLAGAIQAVIKYHDYLNQQPHIINPKAQRNFVSVLAKCDEVTKEFSGKIKAVVNYSTYEASILMLLPYVEFKKGEFMGLLTELSFVADLVRFTPLTNGALQFEIQMPYFGLLEMPQSLGQFLEGNPID